MSTSGIKRTLEAIIYLVSFSGNFEFEPKKITSSLVLLLGGRKQVTESCEFPFLNSFFFFPFDLIIKPKPMVCVSDIGTIGNG